MHENPIHPETHLVCPPTENKPFKAVFALLPVLWPGDGLLNSQPDAPSWPDQQSTLRPVRSMLRSPRLFKDGLPVEITASMPKREQIEAAATSKRFNPRQSPGL